jgi:hypothetical protein
MDSLQRQPLERLDPGMQQRRHLLTCAAARTEYNVPVVMITLMPDSIDETACPPSMNHLCSPSEEHQQYCTHTHHH